MTTQLSRPDAGEYAPFYAGYVAEMPDGDLLAALERQGEETFSLFSALPEERGGHRYAPGKWTVKDVAGHLADAERVFSYRALRFGRGDATALASFDENAYVRAAGAESRPLVELAAELHDVRRATVALFRGFPPEAVTRRGVASGAEMSVRALAWVIAGHERHHVRVLHERYLTG
jgi:hypothetical protein